MVNPWDTLSADNSPFVQVFALIGIPIAAGIINFVVLTSAASAGNSGMFSTSRMLFILASSLLVLLSVIRIFIFAFWGEEKGELVRVDSRQYRTLFIPTALLVIVTILYGVGAEWLTPFMDDAAKLLNDPSIYIDGVMKE